MQPQRLVQLDRQATSDSTGCRTSLPKLPQHRRLLPQPARAGFPRSSPLLPLSRLATLHAVSTALARSISKRSLEVLRCY